MLVSGKPSSELCKNCQLKYLKIEIFCIKVIFVLMGTNEVTKGWLRENVSSFVPEGRAFREGG